MGFSLIIPAASDRPQYESEMPYIFTLSKDGIMPCIKAILGLDLSKFDAIYFTILSAHNIRYNLTDLFDLQLRRLGLDRVKVVVLDTPTRSQVETVYRTIQQEHIEGGIFIKDADSSFRCEILVGNGVVTYPLEQMQLVNPQHKSYIAVDDMFYVTNVIEKRIISHLFNAGGYIFEDARLFCRYCEKYMNLEGLYLSHIIYAMLLDKNIFRPVEARDYVDFDLLA